MISACDGLAPIDYIDVAYDRHASDHACIQLATSHAQLAGSSIVTPSYSYCNALQY